MEKYHANPSVVPSSSQNKYQAKAMKATSFFPLCAPTRVAFIVFSLLSSGLPVFSMHIARTWTTKHWCDSVVKPEWPFAYSKYSSQAEETKGRTSTNLQDIRHVCQTRGVQSKCHICEDISCGNGGDKGKTCHFQLQGVRWDKMSSNIPTVSDVPWSVGGSHRYDFGGYNTTHVCMFVSSQWPCGSSFGMNYSKCNIRCWGYGGGISRKSNVAGDATGVYDSPTGWWPNHRKDNVAGVNATPWTLPGPTATWSYPKYSAGEGPRNPTVEGNLTSLPQGFTFTLAGGGFDGGKAGFKDGVGLDARFRLPESVAVDRHGYVYVADSGNHAIRVVSPGGNVVTLAGIGAAGSRDGPAAEGAMFSSPSGIAIWEAGGSNGIGKTVLFVADTANHRIRKITGAISVNEINNERVWSDVLVECHSGRCGSLIDPEDMPHAAPHSGFADGRKDEARFDSPRGLSVNSFGVVYVADTNNHIIRAIDRHGTARTLAGSFVVAEKNHLGKPLEGCPRPCLAGVQGQLDGALNESQFSYPSDVAVSHGGKAIFVTDRSYLRRIDLMAGRVTTLAGGIHEGELDGQGREASFHKPDAVAATSDGIAYIADAGSCRIRRASPASVLATLASCSDSLSSLLRPSGCSAYDPPWDDFGLKATPVSGDTYYNYLHRDKYDVDLGRDYVGRGEKNCVGSPPPINLDKRRWNDTQDFHNSNLVIDDHATQIREDPNEGTVIKITCPANCSRTGLGKIYGGVLDPPLRLTGVDVMGLFGELSSVCAAAVHSGIIAEVEGGRIDVTIHRQMNSSVILSLQTLSRNGVETGSLMWNVSRLFSVSPSSRDFGIQTIAGAPSVLLGDTCGNHDATPPQEALFGTPTGIAAFVNATLNDASTFLYVADRNNHAIRGISATCSFLCENGGRCIGPDLCRCESGWTGIDCSRPVCAVPCGKREICVGPDVCSCIPGYKGPNCAMPLCVQSCQNGGACSFPDTCSCTPGWFDPNCTTPVCEQTCGNGGNCTSPNLCTCPTDWTGSDCRIPVCEQDCRNGGLCVAPNTCMCPPQWSGFDCGIPICHQGSFVAGLLPHHDVDSDRPEYWRQYVPCNVTIWCEDTNGFDCAQEEKVSSPTFPFFGEEWRFKTGRKYHTTHCILLEIGSEVISPFQYLRSWNDVPTPYHRYSPKTPYNFVSEEQHSWNAVVNPRDGFTYPWKFSIDRQVALVQLHNITEGAYVCANGGRCVAPDICACPHGWIGFDCRVPVCEQGYYEPDQGDFVRGTNLEGELKAFERFMGINTYRLNPHNGGYSNPDFPLWKEHFVNETTLERKLENMSGQKYVRLSNDDQGGYSCSIRSVTKWEDYRSGSLLDHPNYYSRYMNQKVEDDGLLYTEWNNMEWPPTHTKSQKLEINISSISLYGNQKRLFIFTDQGYMRDGDWAITGLPWQKGSCVVEFRRDCDGDPLKARDLEAAPNDGMSVTEHGLLVQDTDKSFRPRIRYDNQKEYLNGAWTVEGGGCVDHVIRGCFNNGTCIGPNNCICAKGWMGHDCSVPICSKKCIHNGNCTLPDTCTCEKGWTGHDCSIAVCAQECQNGGECLAPDVCRCKQWENEWRDGRAEGGVPIFQDPNGDPQMTGWTGYDCSTPICVQAERFLFNVGSDLFLEKVLIPLGGHGKDGLLECDSVRCPEYDEMVTLNNGKSFQSGCGFDPLESGCCDEFDPGENIPLAYLCFRCQGGHLETNQHSLSCKGNKVEVLEFESIQKVPLDLKIPLAAEGPGIGRPKPCGKRHNPHKYYVSTRPDSRPEFSNRNWMANFTSDRFLCNRHTWEQGDYLDSAGLSNMTGIGGDKGLIPGRHTRINFNNYIRDEKDPYSWSSGPAIPGEGIFECHNGGSCIAPDVCTCRDGYTGFDCKTPLCRHQQNNGKVVGCLNGGSCQRKDDCHCIQALSVLWRVHYQAERGLTGWTGTDCSIPICVQGFYDPFCDGPYAPGGEGCYRCANGGTCVAPDTCLCGEGWKGFDCRTPICEAVATPLIRSQLMTVDEEKVHIFETDPCGMVGFYKPDLHDGVENARGNCTLPNLCTCLCKGSYDARLCKEYGDEYCIAPFQDPLFKYRNVLAPNELFGTRTCYSGYEGIVDEKDHFQSCHLTIYEPDHLVKKTVTLIVWGSISLILGCCSYTYFRRKQQRRYLLAQIERRKPGRVAEYAGGGKNAFMHKDIKVM